MNGLSLHRFSKSDSRAFTLIELLIVVAIIGILAAIENPNFLQAESRSKVARVHAEMRQIINSLEIYKLDKNDYPWENSPDPAYYGKVYGLTCLTTPIDYLTSIPFDLFQPLFLDEAGAWAPVVYSKPWEYTYFRQGFYLPPSDPHRWSLWVLVSFGPSRTWDGPAYDPTNGTVSLGNISILQGDASFQERY